MTTAPPTKENVVPAEQAFGLCAASFGLGMLFVVAMLVAGLDLRAATAIGSGTVAVWALAGMRFASLRRRRR